LCACSYFFIHRKKQNRCWHRRQQRPGIGVDQGSVACKEDQPALPEILHQPTNGIVQGANDSHVTLAPPAAAQPPSG
jgi:hypothetical protein